MTDIRELARALNRDAATIAPIFLGEPNRHLSRPSRELRFGTKGSLSIDLTGHKAGIWCCHEDGQGGDILDLIARELGSKAHAIEWAKTHYGEDAPPPMPPAKPQVVPDVDAEREAARKIEAARRFLGRTLPVAGTQAEFYLREGRGISGPLPACLRYHPSAFTTAAIKSALGVEQLPALACPMRGARSGEVVAAHITYLHPEEPRRIKTATDGADGRRYMGRPSGNGNSGPGVIMITPFAEVTAGLGITEGLENGLVALNHYGFAPVWVTGDAGRLASFPPLPGIEALTVFADNDAPGRKAAFAVQSAWHQTGLDCNILTPGADGADLADMAGAA